VKRQFVRIQLPTAGNNAQQGFDEQFSVENQNTSPTRKVPVPHAEGLLAGTYENSRLSFPDGRRPVTPDNSFNPQTDANPRIVDQETVIQQAVARPITGPIFNRAMQQGYPLEQMPTSPASSGIWSHAAPAPVQQSPVTQSAAPAYMQRFAQNAPVQQGAPSWQPPLRPGTYPSSAPLQTPLPGQLAGKKRRFPIWARVAVAVLTVLLVALGSGLWYYQSNFAVPITKITNQQAAHIGEDGKSANQLTTTGNGIGTKRINILLLGSDNDGKNQAPLAQTDIVVTIDPETHYVGMLSIPRDLRVVIPDNGTGKMDAAFSFGWTNEHVGPTPFSNAAGLSIATVEKNFGIPINYYAWVGLDGFIKVIDTAGGVDIDAIHPITDNAYPDDVNTKDHFAYERLYIPPGPQHMNGLQALQYVRTRHADLVGDFGRSARQQQILDQLKVKLDTPSIVTKLPELANDLGDTVKTDMSLQDIVNFMDFARTLDTNKVNRLILSPPYSTIANDNTGDFLPNCAMIMPKIAQMFALGNNANCITAASNNTGSALTSFRSAPGASATMSALSAPAQSTALSQLNALSQNTDETLGMHSLLDMMFLVVFASFEGTKV
jgi:LCP family protein required for cell wall assembly